MKTKVEDGKLIIEMDITGINEDILSFLSAIEISQKSKATQEDIDKLSEEITKNWWEKNKGKYVDED
jgi:phosphotransferase system IIA component